MRVGLFLLQDVPWAALRERATRADEMGCDTIWVADHLLEPYQPEGPWSEAWTLLGALAATTKHATLGALTSSLTLRNPTLLVQAAQTLRDISGGRADLALGAGGAPLDHQMTGVPHWSPAERADRFAEFVPLVASILRDGRTPAGPAPAPRQYYTLENVKLQRSGGIRLTIAGLGPRSIALAARYGDAWNSYGVPAGKRLTEGRLTPAETLDLFRQRIARFTRGCVAAGRDPSTIGKSYTWFESYMGPGLPALDECVATARDFRDAGATEFIVYWPRDDVGADRLGELVRLLHEL